MGLLERHWRIIFGIALIPGLWMVYNSAVRGIEIGEFSYGPDGYSYTSSYTEVVTRIFIPGGISIVLAAVAEVGRRRSLSRPRHAPADDSRASVPQPPPEPDPRAAAEGPTPPEHQHQSESRTQPEPETHAQRTKGTQGSPSSQRVWLMAGIGAMSVGLLASAALLVVAVMLRDGPYPQRALTPTELDQLIPADSELPGTLRADASGSLPVGTFFFDAERAQQEMGREHEHAQILREQILEGDPQAEGTDACLEAIDERTAFWQQRADSMVQQGPEGIGAEAERTFTGPDDLRVTGRYESYEAFEGFGDVWEQQSAVCLPVLAAINGGTAETRMVDEDGIQGYITVFEYPEHSGVSVNLYSVMGSSSVQYWSESSDPGDDELIVETLTAMLEHAETTLRTIED